MKLSDFIAKLPEEPDSLMIKLQSALPENVAVAMVRVPLDRGPLGKT